MLDIDQCGFQAVDGESVEAATREVHDGRPFSPFVDAVWAIVRGLERTLVTVAPNVNVRGVAQIRRDTRRRWRVGGSGHWLHHGDVEMEVAFKFGARVRIGIVGKR